MALFTPETAADMAKRSWEARRAKEQAEPQPAQEPQIAEPALDFVTQRLSRVRAQLVRLDALAAEEDDPKRIREYADATSRLQEQERQLAGRPLPGTLKPSTPKSRRSDPMPEPTVPQQAQPGPSTAQQGPV